MTWQLFTTVGLNQRLRLELLHPCNTLAIAWDMNPCNNPQPIIVPYFIPCKPNKKIPQDSLHLYVNEVQKVHGSEMYCRKIHQLFFYFFKLKIALTETTGKTFFLMSKLLCRDVKTLRLYIFIIVNVNFRVYQIIL